MRLPIGVDLLSRDGTTDKDARIKNGFVETRGDASVAKKRPGTVSLGSGGSGAAQLLANWAGGLQSVVGDTLNKLTISSRTQPVDQVFYGTGTYALPAAPTAMTANGIAANGNAMVIPSSSGAVFRSSDGGYNWTQTKSDTTNYYTFSCAAYGAGTFVVLAYGYNYGTSANGAPVVLYSIDNGASWTSTTYSATSMAFGATSVVYGDKFVAVGYTGTTSNVFYSSNGISWSAASSGVSSALVQVVYGGGNYVAVGSAGKVVYSSNGTSWNLGTSGVSSAIVSVVYNGTQFVAATSDGDILFSATGATWTRYAGVIPLGSYTGSVSVYSLSYLNGTYVAIAGGDNAVDMWASSTGTATFTNAASYLGMSGGSYSQPVLNSFGEYIYSADENLGGNRSPGALAVTLDSVYFASISSSASISTLSSSLSFSSESTGAAASSQYLFIKNSQQGFTLNAAGTLTAVSDADYPGWFVYSVTSITRAGSTATVTTSASSNIKTGTSVTIAGAAQTEYNGTFTVTVTGANTFTYSVTGTPTTPATGTITATGGITTVPGVVWLDGTFYVMDQNATIYGSDLNTPASWNALNFITAIKEPGAGKAIAKSQNYVIALKEWSTEFFFDAGNATGSPLSPVDNGFTLVGCASGDSVANVDGTLFWMSQTRQKGRGVVMMNGLQQVPISTPDVERVLNADSLASVVAFGVKISGHTFYVLTLKTTGVTLVYNTTSKTWSEWTSMTAQSTKSCTITSSNGIATVICNSHGYADGDPVTIAGAAQTQYNGLKQIRYVDSNTFTYSVSGSPATPATGTITCMGYTSSYFKYTKYVYANGKDLVMHETNGGLYEITESAYLDDTSPIDFAPRTFKFDGDSTQRKTCGKAEVIGNKISDIAMIRWSDDDYATYSPYAQIDLSAERSQARRCGSFRRRAFELRYVGSQPLTVSALELDLGA